jgi:hypothetical protein
MEQQVVGNLAHSIPGRMRLRIASEHRVPLTFARLKSLLVELPGIRNVEENSSTGSVLILYDPAVLPPGNLLRLGTEFGLDGCDAARAAMPSGQQGMSAFNPADLWRGAKGRVDHEVSHAVSDALLYTIASLVGGAASAAVGWSGRLGAIGAPAAIYFLRKASGGGGAPPGKR